MLSLQQCEQASRIDPTDANAIRALRRQSASRFWRFRLTRAKFVRMSFCISLILKHCGFRSGRRLAAIGSKVCTWNRQRSNRRQSLAAGAVGGDRLAVEFEIDPVFAAGCRQRRSDLPPSLSAGAISSRRLSTSCLPKEVHCSWRTSRRTKSQIANRLDRRPFDAALNSGGQASAPCA